MGTLTRGPAQRLGNTWSQTFFVDNRPGAGSQVALELLAAAASEGHTLTLPAVADVPTFPEAGFRASSW